MKSYFKKLSQIFIYVVVLFSFLPNRKALAEMSIEEKYQHFKTGVLKDFTPKEISSDFISVRPEGPFFMVVGVDRGEKYVVDFRDPSQREKIKFEVIKGSGSFADIKNPEDKKSDPFLIAPNDDGAVAVLFYPSKSFFSPKDEEYQIKASVVNQGYLLDVRKLFYKFLSLFFSGNTEFQFMASAFNQGSTDITGEISYKFKGIDLDQDLLNKVKSGYIDLANTASKIPRTVTVHTNNVTHDRFGLQPDSNNTDDFSTTINPDGSSQTTDSHGVVRQKKAVEEDGSLLSVKNA